MPPHPCIASERRRYNPLYIYVDRPEDLLSPGACRSGVPFIMNVVNAMNNVEVAARCEELRRDCLPRLSDYVAHHADGLYFLRVLNGRRYCVLAIAWLLFSGACVPVPVHMPPLVAAPVPMPAGASPDLAFVIPHHTSREDVLQRLGWADVGLNDGHLFWGHWDTSARGRSWAMVFPQSGRTAPTRVWTSHNIVIEFDETGLVVSARTVEDKDLAGEFVSWAHSHGKNQPPSNLLLRKTTFFATTPKFSFRYLGHGRVSVEREGFEVVDRERQVRFQVTRDQIVRVAVNPLPLINRSADRGPATPPRVELKLALKDKTPWGRKMSVYVEPSLFLTAMQYFVPESR